MSISRGFYRCKHCRTDFLKDIVIQYMDGNNWNHCPNCGEPWDWSWISAEDA